MKAEVNKDTCISCGLCVNTCQEVFHFDEDNKAEAIDDEIEDVDEVMAVEARDGCPVDAIDIKE